MTSAELRERYACGERDFRGVDLRRRNLTGIDLCLSDLSGADLRGADLSGADLTDAKLENVRCGLSWQWRLVKAVIQLGAGVLSVVVMPILIHWDFDPVKHICVSLISFVLLLASIVVITTSISPWFIADNRDAGVWWASLFGTRFIGANLTRASFANSCLDGANFFEARLDGCIFHGARESIRARFSPGPLRYLPLLDLITKGHSAQAYFAGLDLEGLAIRDANVTGADLTETNLRGCDLHGTDLTRAARLKETRIDPDTYARSGWDPDHLLHLHRRGVLILWLNQFPDEVQDLLLGTREGLSVYFDRPLNALDHLLIQSVITQELGPDTDCRIAEIKEKDQVRVTAQRGDHAMRAEVVMEGPRALVRLKASHREDLLRIADRLYRCVREREQEQRQQEHSAALVHQKQEFDLVLSQQKDHVVALARLVREFQTRTATHLQGMELHDPVDGQQGAADPNARRPTRRSIAYDLKTGQITTDQRPRRLALLAAPEDAAHVKPLLKQMSSLRQSGLLHAFHESGVLPGTDSVAALHQAVAEADLILCLVSADLLALLDPEAATTPLGAALRLALQRRDRDGVVVIPVLARATDLTGSPFGALKALPRNGEPITAPAWAGNYDGALLDVVAGVRLHLVGDDSATH